MPVAVLHQKIDLLPEECFAELETFLDFLKFKASQNEAQTTEKYPNRRFEIAKPNKGFGCLHNDDFWMADDFDETPEDFKDYM